MKPRTSSSEWNGNRIIRTAVFGLATIVLSVMLYLWWNRPPAVQHDNLRYIQLLRTAVSSRSPDQLSRVAGALEKRRTNGLLSETEHEHFLKIINAAEQGEWTDADVLTRDFEVAQLNRTRPDQTP